MDPLNIKDEIAKLRREIAQLQAKRREAATDEDDHENVDLQVKINELGKRIDELEDQQRAKQP